MSGSGWFRRQQSLSADKESSAASRSWKSLSVTQPKRRGAALTASGAALVLGAGVMIVAFASPGSHASLVASEGPANAINGAKPLQPATALQMVSVTPAAGAKGVNGTSSVRVRFSQPLAPNSPMPTLSPSVSGHWAVQGPIAVDSARALGHTSPAYLGLMSMAVAVGEGVANIIQPFWLLPLLAIAKLNVRQVMGFTIVAFLIGLVVLGATTLIAPYVV